MESQRPALVGRVRPSPSVRMVLGGATSSLVVCMLALSSACAPANGYSTAEASSAEDAALWRDLNTLSVGGGSEWVFVEGTWSDSVVVGVLNEVDSEVLRFPGGLFANAWSLSAETLLTVASESGGYRGRLESYERRLKEGAGMLADSALIRYTQRSGVKVLWVVSPFDASLREDVDHILDRTPLGDTALVELGNEIYDGWFLTRAISPRDLAMMRDSVDRFARVRGRKIRVALPSSVGDAGARKPLWEHAGARLSFETAAIHLYVGEHPAVCASCGAREYVHTLIAGVVKRTGKQRLWITEVNVDARRKDARAGRRSFAIGDAEHGLVVASVLLHLATEERVDLLLVHALLGSGAYGLYQAAAGQRGTTWRIARGLEPVAIVLRHLSRSDAIREVQCSNERSEEDECFEMCDGGDLIAVHINWQTIELSLLHTESVACAG